MGFINVVHKFGHVLTP